MNKIIKFIAVFTTLLLLGATVHSAVVRIDHEGYTTVDGSRIFPIGLYSSGYPDELEAISQAGFNVVQHYYFYVPTSKFYNGPEDFGLEPSEEEGTDVLARKFLDMAQQHNLYAVLGFRKGDISQMDYSRISKTVETFKNHPALLAWQSADGPAKAEISPKATRELYLKVSQIDPDHPVIGVVSEINKYDKYIWGRDVLMFDCYPIPDDLISKVRDYSLLANRAVYDWSVGNTGRWEMAPESKPTKTWWPVLQTVWPTYLDPENFGMPTPVEMRNMTYQSVIMGAKGIFYYTYKNPKFNLREHKENWQSLKSIVREIRVLEPYLLDADKIPGSFSYEPGILSAAWIKDDEALVIASNLFNYEVSAPILLYRLGAGRIKKDIDVLFEDREIMSLRGVIKDEFQPLAVHIYRFKLNTY